MTTAYAQSHPQSKAPPSPALPQQQQQKQQTGT